MLRRRWFVVLAVVVVAALAGGLTLSWRARSGGTGACDAPAHDPLDSRSLQHALPGSPPPSYATEPPTSGPHQPGRLGGGVVGGPLSGPVQVGALEAGQVLLQHRDLPPDDLRALESLGGPLVVVAPNPALPAPIVASAWRTRQQCRAVDVDALSRFVHDHAGHEPTHGG